MSKPDSTEVPKSEEKILSIYQMPYNTVKSYSSGLRPHPMFPNQQKLKTHKPLLSDLIDSVEDYANKNNLHPVFYNIEPNHPQWEKGNVIPHQRFSWKS